MTLLSNYTTLFLGIGVVLRFYIKVVSKAISKAISKATTITRHRLDTDLTQTRHRFDTDLTQTRLKKTRE